MKPYVQVKGKWAYLYAAKRFLSKALKPIPLYARPKTINADKDPCYGKAIS